MATKEAPEDKKQDQDGAQSSEESTALFDQPLILEGKRKRKSVEMFSFSPQDEKSIQSYEYGGGKGMKLGDIPIIEYQIGKIRADDLKILYRICYDTVGNTTKVIIKRNLRSFNGFDFNEDSDQFKKKKVQLERLSVAILKTVCDYLDLDKSGNKEDIVNKIITFLMKPEDDGKAPPAPRKRKSSVGEKVDRKKAKISDKDKKSERDDEEGKDKDEEMESSQVEEESSQVENDVEMKEEDKGTDEVEEDTKQNTDKEQSTDKEQKENDDKEVEKDEINKDDTNNGADKDSETIGKDTAVREAEQGIQEVGGAVEGDTPTPNKEE